MSIIIQKAKSNSNKGNQLILIDQIDDVKKLSVSKEESKYAEKNLSDKKNHIIFNRYDSFIVLYLITKKKENYLTRNQIRRDAHSILLKINEYKPESIEIIDLSAMHTAAYDFAEGLALSTYSFTKYFSDKKDKESSLKSINIFSELFSKEDALKLTSVIEGTFLARNLVNEPVIYLTARKLADEAKKASEKAGYSIDIFDKKKIESLKMGGLLAVNLGSVDPPTFSILEWKPEKAKNKKPIVLVGKGVVYDTGGLSLKPTPNSMDSMKCDMGGAAAVIGAMYAVSKAKLPYHVVALIPATDNRPGGNAYTPGDVITMFNGSTVEVLNTDAEGRMILADALAYAAKYKPELVIDLATLTGAAVAAFGTSVIAGMGTANSEIKEKLTKSSYDVFERIAEMPFWDDYAELIKSDIADLKNLGGPYAGSITAGKFLEHFTKDKKGEHAYPWLHLDIAGPAYLSAADSYRGKNATGVGVRLLFDFIKNYQS